MTIARSPLRIGALAAAAVVAGALERPLPGVALTDAPSRFPSEYLIGCWQPELPADAMPPANANVETTVTSWCFRETGAYAAIDMICTTDEQSLQRACRMHERDEKAFRWDDAYLEIEQADGWIRCLPILNASDHMIFRGCAFSAAEWAKTTSVH